MRQSRGRSVSLLLDWLLLFHIGHLRYNLVPLCNITGYIALRIVKTLVFSITGSWDYISFFVNFIIGNYANLFDPLNGLAPAFLGEQILEVFELSLQKLVFGS